MRCPIPGSSRHSISVYWIVQKIRITHANSNPIVPTFTRVNVGTIGFELAWVILIFWTIQYTLMLWRLDPGIGHRILTPGVGFCAMTIPFLMMGVTAFWAGAAYHARSG